MHLNRYLFIPFLLTLSIYFPAKISAQNSEVTVKDIGWGKVDIAGFSLSRDAEVTLIGRGISYNRRHGGEAAYAWILNSDNRKVVWSLLNDDDFDNSGRPERFHKEIDFKKGDYEIYYTYMGFNSGDDYDFGDFLSDIFTLGRRYRRRDRDNNEQLYMTVKGPENIFKSNDGREIVDKKSNNAIVSIIRTMNDRNIKKGFTLTGNVKLHVYALGESRSRSSFDYGWITDVKTNKRVWIMDREWATNAGGGEKNILVNEDITLPAGSYMVHYVTDDSHSFMDWNVPPPNDPQFWGITIWAISKEDYDKVKPFRKEDMVKPIIEITRVRDDENLSKGFSLPQGMDLRILCLGEEGHRDMVDYGWIINADTRETVWRLTKDNTENAGGAEKNRMIDEVVHFEKGNYIAYYTSDDSHSFNDWNSDPPFDPEQWGITIWTNNENDAKKVKLFNEDDIKSKDVIAQIIKVRDNDHIRKFFTLSKETKLRIYAIGEGTGNDMNDYGWIENKKTGRTVWEMTYRQTENAGGANKNRMFNG